MINLINIDFSRRRKVEKKFYDTESRLLVFGDSFLETYREKDMIDGQVPWVDILAKSMSCNLVSYAVSGSSLNYSVQNFFHYMENDYRHSDFILFSSTCSQRAPFLLDDNQHGIHFALSHWYLKNKDLPINQYNEYNKDSKFWNTYVERAMYYDDYKNLYKLIFNYIEYLNNRSLFLHSFYEKDNFNPFALRQISTKENMKNFDNVNHMSEYNKIILAKQSVNYFSDLKYSNFNIDEYESYN